MRQPADFPHWIAPPPACAAAPVLVGFSGGMDSTALLLRLHAARGARPLRAVHVDHGLHPDSATWAAHCAEVCTGLGITLDVVRVQVNRDGGLGLEGEARAARRAAFTGQLRTGEVLALAQHRDDQAETFLLRALRASGTDGLAAMRPWRGFAAGWLWRPLLATPRDALRAYVQAKAIRWIEDPSNADTDRDRNFLRQRVLPLLRERWPAADAALSRSAALSAESADLLLAEDDGLLEGCRTDTGDALVVAALQALPPTRRARVLRHWVAIHVNRGHAPAALPAEGVAWVERALLGTGHDTEACFAWAGTCIRRWRDALYLLPARHGQGATQAGHWHRTWDGLAPLPLPEGGSLALEGVEGFGRMLSVCSRRGGERIRLPGRTHRNSLKQLLQDRGVPPWVRVRMPMLVDDTGTLLAAGDAIVADTFAAWLDARGARLQWRQD